MTDLRGIWCVIPVYNNAATVFDIVARARRILPNVLVVDDGSTDRNLAECFSGSGIPVLRHEHNLGKGAAILTALNHLSADPSVRYMITLDADGQHDPEDIPRFYPLMARNDYSLLIGCRDFSVPNVPASSRFGRKFANFWMRIETGVKVGDCQSGFRAYPVRYVSRLHFLTRRYNFETEILTRAAWANLELHDVPIHTHYPKKEERISHFDPWKDNFRLACIHAHLVGIRMLPIPKKKLRPSPGFPYSIFRPGELFRALLRENASPEGLGVSAGVSSFLAVLPLPGCHILAILYTAERLHLNKIMALAIQNLYMPPLSPFLCIELGYRMRNGAWLTELTLQSGVKELHLRLYEWFLGSLILAPFWGIVSGILVYFITLFLQKRRKRNGEDGKSQ